MKETQTSRRNVISAALALAAVGAGSAWWLRDTTPESIEHASTSRGRDLLAKIPCVDVHAHPARTFLANGQFDDPVIQSLGHASEADRINDMRVGGVAASLFAIVADVQVLGFTPQGGISAQREFEPGEAYADFNRQLDYFSKLENEGTVSFARTADCVREAHAVGQPVAILACEGGDFVEDQLGRLELAYEQGLRSIGIMHYKPNAYGDIQTAAPEHNGLSKLGAEFVAEMNRLGMLIDAAHATFETTKGMVEASSAPIMVSHSHLMHEDMPNPRLISAEHAKLVAEAGGIIGSWPAGITNRSMDDFVDETLRLVDAVGIDHVAVGTDLDANYRPVLTEYAQFPDFAERLLDRGLSEEEAGKILGTNFLRVFGEATKAA